MLAISIAGISWAHKLRVGYKLATLSILSIFIFYVNSLFLLLLILFGILLLYYSVSIAVLRKGILLLRPLILVIGLIWIFHIIREEFLSGTVICLRLIILFAKADWSENVTNWACTWYGNSIYPCIDSALQTITRKLARKRFETYKLAYYSANFYYCY